MSFVSFNDPKIKNIFAGFAKEHREGLMLLRQLIFDVAAENPQIGKLDEALRWGQPSYLTSETKAGSTLRLGQMKTGGFALFAHCQTDIISSFKELFPNDFIFEKNRAVCFKSSDEIQSDKLKLLIRHALTYHLK